MASITEIIHAEQKRIETVLRAAYEAGKADAKREMLLVLSGGDPKSAISDGFDDTDGDRKRAPRGLPRKLTTRVLYENYIFGGVTPQKICDAAVTDYEKMIAPSSIRSELRRGAEEGRYEESGDGWTLSNQLATQVEQRLAAGDMDPYR